MDKCRKVEHYVVRQDTVSGDWSYESGGEIYGNISRKDLAKLIAQINVMQKDLQDVKQKVLIIVDKQLSEVINGELFIK